MYELVAFRFSTDGTDWSVATVVPTGLQIGTSSTIVKVDHLDELSTAVDELLGQAEDGVDDTEKTVTGALASGGDLVVKYVRASNTVTVGSQVAWSAVKAQAFVDALTALEVIPSAP